MTKAKNLQKYLKNFTNCQAIRQSAMGFFIYMQNHKYFSMISKCLVCLIVLTGCQSGLFSSGDRAALENMQGQSSRFSWKIMPVSKEASASEIAANRPYALMITPNLINSQPHLRGYVGYVLLGNQSSQYVFSSLPLFSGLSWMDSFLVSSFYREQNKWFETSYPLSSFLTVKDSLGSKLTPMAKDLGVSVDNGRQVAWIDTYLASTKKQDDIQLILRVTLDGHAQRVSVRLPQAKKKKGSKTGETRKYQISYGFSGADEAITPFVGQGSANSVSALVFGRDKNLSLIARKGLFKFRKFKAGIPWTYSADIKLSKTKSQLEVFDWISGLNPVINHLDLISCKEVNKAGCQSKKKKLVISVDSKKVESARQSPGLMTLGFPGIKPALRLVLPQNEALELDIQKQNFLSMYIDGEKFNLQQSKYPGDAFQVSFSRQPSFYEFNLEVSAKGVFGTPHLMMRSGSTLLPMKVLGEGKSSQDISKLGWEKINIGDNLLKTAESLVSIHVVDALGPICKVTGRLKSGTSQKLTCARDKSLSFDLLRYALVSDPGLPSLKAMAKPGTATSDEKRGLAPAFCLGCKRWQLQESFKDSGLNVHIYLPQGREIESVDSSLEAFMLRSKQSRVRAFKSYANQYFQGAKMVAGCPTHLNSPSDYVLDASYLGINTFAILGCRSVAEENILFRFIDELQVKKNEPISFLAAYPETYAIAERPAVPTTFYSSNSGSPLKRSVPMDLHGVGGFIHLAASGAVKPEGIPVMTRVWSDSYRDIEVRAIGVFKDHTRVIARQKLPGKQSNALNSKFRVDRFKGLRYVRFELAGKNQDQVSEPFVRISSTPFISVR